MFSGDNYQIIMLITRQIAALHKNPTKPDPVSNLVP